MNDVDAYKQRIDAWARRYAVLMADVRSYCADLTDADLAEFIAGSYLLTDTNCWWATYDIAPHVRAEARDVQVQRERMAKQWACRRRCAARGGVDRLG